MGRVKWCRINSSVKPGQEVKCPRLMALISVETTGHPTILWRKEAKSALVAEDQMALLAMFVGCGGPADVIFLNGNGIFQSPLSGLRVPVRMIDPFFTILTRCLSKRAVQSSSQSFPIEMRDPVVSPSRM